MVLQLLENDGWWGPDKNQFDGWWVLKFLLMGGVFLNKEPPDPRSPLLFLEFPLHKNSAFLAHLSL